MTVDRVIAYQEGKCDLRYALSHANLRRYWRFKFDGQHTGVLLEKVKKLSDDVQESLPEPGFFAREHEAIKIVATQVSDTDERFEIDGSWELGEFSHFYGQVEDLYYVFTDLQRFEDAP